MLDYDPGSFKDPEGRVFYADGRVFRTLSASALARMRRLTESGHLQALIDSGLLLPCRLVPAGESGSAHGESGSVVMEHTRIEVLTYAYEWSFDMLRDAALVTLDLLQACLERHLILKDATPYNVAYREGRFVFFDTLSLDDYAEGQPWEGYAQFCREFLFPLMLTAYKKLDFQMWLRGSPAGISATDFNRLLGVWDYRRRGAFKHVGLQSHLERAFAGQGVETRESFGRIGYSRKLLERNVRSLRDVIRSLRYDRRDSEWLRYGEEHSYSKEAERLKRAFVQDGIGKLGGKTLLDIGCNTGAYSFLAAERIDCAIALDGDPACIDAVYREARDAGNPRVIPLVADLLNPSPPLGWALTERKGLFERVKSDAFLALAVIHHLCIGGNVPMSYVADALARLGKGGVVEWVEKSDPMVQRMLRNRTDIFDAYCWETFMAEMSRHFDLRDQCPLSDTRRLCLFARKSGTGSD